jgi:tetratricopeptide (TPR) repeat protein
VLKDNQKAFADGWELVPALQLLARLQEEKGDTEAAGQAYADLAEVPGITAAMKLDSQLHGARLLLSAKKFTDAEIKLKQLASAMPADDPQRTHVEVYLAQSQIAQERLDGIEKKLKDAIAASEDKKLRALAHNALGDYYRAKKEMELAFWEYLKVETMYDVDRDEEAKALYWLSKLFDQPKNDIDRAKDCLTKLQGQRFDGTPYQRMAASEKKEK